MTVWSPSRLELAVQCCRHSDNVRDATALFNKRSGLDVRPGALANAMQNRGLGSPADNLRTGLRTVGDGSAPAQRRHAMPPPPPAAPAIAIEPAPTTARSGHIEPLELEVPITLDLDEDGPTATAISPDESAEDSPESKSEPPPPLDPVQKREAQEEASNDKRAIKQLVEQLREARARQAFLDEVARHKQPPRILPREVQSGMREMTAIVLGSDWHIEEEVDPESVAGRNAYNLEIADRRVTRFFEGVIWHVEHHRASKRIAINDLVLWLGGDLFSGYIHEELVEGNQLSPVEAVRWLIPRLRDGIYTLLKRLDLAHIEIPCSFGNHGRTTHKTRVSTGYANSFDFLLYHSLADEFRHEPRIHFQITASSHQYVEVYGRTIHFTHGDSLKYQGGIGGLSVPLMKALRPWELVKDAAVHCIGHFHQLTDLGRAVVNGSMIGYGPYSLFIRANYEPPQQAMFFMDSKRGKCLTSAIWLDDDVDERRLVS